MQEEQSSKAGSQEIVTAIADCGKAFHRFVEFAVGSPVGDSETDILIEVFSRFMWFAKQFEYLEKEPCTVESARILLLLRADSLDLILEDAKPKDWTAHSYRLEEIVKIVALGFAERGAVEAVLGMRKASTAVTLEGEQPTAGSEQIPNGHNSGIKTTRPKKSTANGDAQTKLSSAFLKHHQFEKRSIGNNDPIGINELARQATVASSTAKTFIDKWFPGGFRVYQRDARGDRTKLLIALTQLSGDPVLGLIPNYGTDPDKQQDND